MQEKGQCDPRRSFYKCFLANECIMLKDGKLYTCTLIPNIEHFNKHFKKKLEVCGWVYRITGMSKTDT